jgi:hypothetical protein
LQAHETLPIINSLKQTTQTTGNNMNAITLAKNVNFQAIAAVDAVKLLAEKSGINSLELMRQFVSGENLELSNEIAKMVAFAAEVTAAEL